MLTCAIVELSCVNHRRALPAVFAVPAMTIEEDEMRMHPGVALLVHAKKPFHRSFLSALAHRVESSHREDDGCNSFFGMLSPSGCAALLFPSVDVTVLAYSSAPCGTR